MPTINISREAMDTVEAIRDTFPIRPSKRKVAEKALNEYLVTRRSTQKSEQNDEHTQ